MISPSERRNAVIYQVYPRSYNDSNGDGIGDLDGITQRIDHIAKLGVDGIWLSPIFASPQADMGYDVSDYLSVAPEYGDVAAADRLVAAAHARGLFLLLDIVPCHTSIEHPWFRDHPEWYIIRDTEERPNNWTATFGGRAWDRDPFGRGWYCHTFYPEQPNLNWRNPEVVAAMHGVLRWWFERGVDGFRIDAVDRLFVDEHLRDEPAATREYALVERPDYASLDHIHTVNQPEVFGALRDLRADFPDKFLVTEAYCPVGELHRYTEHVDLTFCFELMQSEFDVQRFADVITEGSRVPGIAWMLSNHDFPRMVTRWNRDVARTAATMQLTLPGAAFIYQGDEIGLADGPGADPPFDRVGRDSARHPMQWTPSGGFTTGSPWLSMVDAAECNVADQDDDPASMLSLYRDLIEMRQGLSGEVSDVRVEGAVLRYSRDMTDITLNFGTTATPIGTGTLVLATQALEADGCLPGYAAAVMRR